MNHLQVKYYKALITWTHKHKTINVPSGVKKISANPDDDEGEPEYKFEWQGNFSLSLMEVKVNVFITHES